MKTQLISTYAETMQSSSSTIYSFLENSSMKIHLGFKTILVVIFLCSIMLTIGEASAGAKGFGHFKVTQSWIDVNGTSNDIYDYQFVGGMITCTPEGPTNYPLGFAGGMGGQIAVTGGSYCSVTAVPPPSYVSLNMLAHYPACNGGKAHFITSYSAQQVAIMTNAVATIAVKHTLKCDLVTPTFRATPK